MATTRPIGAKNWSADRTHFEISKAVDSILPSPGDKESPIVWIFGSVVIFGSLGIWLYKRSKKSSEPAQVATQGPDPLEVAVIAEKTVKQNKPQPPNEWMDFGMRFRP